LYNTLDLERGTAKMFFQLVGPFGRTDIYRDKQAFDSSSKENGGYIFDQGAIGNRQQRLQRHSQEPLRGSWSASQDHGCLGREVHSFL
jgi:hypothetical protein